MSRDVFSFVDHYGCLMSVYRYLLRLPIYTSVLKMDYKLRFSLYLKIIKEKIIPRYRSKQKAYLYYNFNF